MTTGQITPAPHELNTGFEWHPVPRAGGMLSGEEVDQFDREGYLLVEGAITVEEIERVRDELDAYEAKMTRWLDQQGGTLGISDAKDITFSPHAVTRSEIVKEFSRHPVFARLALDLVGPDVRLYWDQAVYKKPEPDREFPWHQDNGYTFVHPQHYLTCWIPLVPATHENGCPVVAPGVHRQGTLAHHWVDPIGWQCLTDPERAVEVEADVGDIICFSSLMPHRTGPNTTDEIRKAYILQYCAEGSTAFDPRPQNDDSRQFPVVRGGVPVES